jgi:uncharacterized membrane protein
MVEAARYNVVSGLIAAALTAIAGVHDYLAHLPPGSSGRRLGRWHALLNVIATGLFAAGLGDRWAARGASATPMEPFVLSALGVVLLGVSAYLGGVIVMNYARR